MRRQVLSVGSSDLAASRLRRFSETDSVTFAKFGAYTARIRCIAGTRVALMRRPSRVYMAQARIELKAASGADNCGLDFDGIEGFDGMDLDGGEAGIFRCRTARAHRPILAERPQLTV